MVWSVEGYIHGGKPLAPIQKDWLKMYDPFKEPHTIIMLGDPH